MCLAGSVMLMRMSDEDRPAAMKGGCMPELCNGNENIWRQLYALNSARDGDLPFAIKRFYGYWTDVPEELVIAGPMSSLDEFNPEFIREMKRRAKILAKAGF